MLITLHPILGMTPDEGVNHGDLVYLPLSGRTDRRLDRAIGDRSGRIQLLREAHAILVRASPQRTTEESTAGPSENGESGPGV
jgi:hypothetical protein